MLSTLVLSGRLAPVPVDELSTGDSAPAKTFAERSSAIAATLALAGSSGAVADSSRSASAASAKIRSAEVSGPDCAPIRFNSLFEAMCSV